MTNENYLFSMDEYNSRVSKARQVMSDRGIDVVLIDQFEHLVYLFGYLPTAAKYQACLLPLEGDPHMIVRGMDLSVFHQHSWVTSHTVFADSEDSVGIVGQEIANRFPRGSRIGMEFDSHLLTVQRYRFLRDALSGYELADFSGVLIEMRLIKSAAELSCMKGAASIADASMNAAIEASGEGINEREPAAAAYFAAMRLGADNGRVLLTSSGPASDAIHGPLGTRTLLRGDILHLEMVPQLRGYSSRLMRPVMIGAVDAELARITDRLIAIQDEQIAAMAPGRIGSEIDAIARDQIIREGIAKDYPNHTGYTLGHHAQPRTSDHTRIFTTNASWALAKGMIFHMFVTARGVAIGETIHVTADGSERLTSTPRQFFLK